MKFNEYMKKAREDVGLTQDSAAAILNVSIQTIQNWEKDILPTNSNWKAIIELYKLDLREFSDKYFQSVVPQEDVKNDTESNIPEFLFDDKTLEEIKNIVLTEQEQELLGMELIYPKFRLSKDTMESSYYKEEIYGFAYYFPYEYVKRVGCFKLRKLINSLDSKIQNYRKFIINKILENPEKLFNINDLNPKDYLELSKNSDGFFKNLLEIFEKIIENDNKIAVKEIGYTGSWSRYYPDRWENEKNPYNIDFEQYRKSRYFTFVTMECDDEEYIKEQEQYKMDLEFYEKHKNMMDHAPNRPRYKAKEYVQISEQGYQLLNWYKEYIL